MEKKAFARLFLIIVAAAIVSSGLAACRQSSPEVLELKMGGPPNIALLPLIALERGFFAEKGVSVVFEQVQTGKATLDAVIAGDLDVGVVVETNIAYLGLQEGAAAVAFASIATKTDDAIVARRDHGIESPADLRNRTIGYLPATTSDAFLWRFLRANEILPSEVSLISMPPPALQAAVAQGEVDAVSVWQPFRFNALNTLGSRGAEFNDPSVYRSFNLLVARRAYLEEHREEILALLRGVLQARDWASDYPSEAQRLLALRIPMGEDALSASWGEYSLEIAPPSTALDTIAAEATHIVETVEAYRERSPPTYDELVDDSLVSTLQLSAR